MRVSPMLVLLAALGCSDKSTDGAPATDDTADSAAEAADLPNGLFLLDFSISAVGGIVIPFQAEVSSTEDEEGNRTFASFSLRASDGVDAVSDVLTTVEDVPIDAQGAFALALGNFVLPGAFSPTDGDLDLNATLTGHVDGPEFFCGDVTGMVVTVGLDLAGSTFGAVPWETRADSATAACETGEEALPRVDAADCPTLADGENTAFLSGGEQRSFEVVVPDGYSADEAWPLVFLYHGFGGAPTDMLDSGGARAWSSEAEMILIAPQAMDRSGAVSWDAFSGEANNTDIVLFDDLLTCAATTWNIDPDRIYATGMSNGGLFTGSLIAQRSTVLAAAAPFSGGIKTDFAESPDPIPVQVTWGGPEDDAYDVDFNQAAQDMIAAVQANGSFAIACEHDQGHEFFAEFWDWTFPFFAAHPKGVSPEPYADGLPESYPEWCAIAGQ